VKGKWDRDRTEFVKTYTPRVKRYPLRSSNIASAGRTLMWGIVEIEFQNGDIYRYFDVPWTKYRGMRKATSQGRYFNRHIRSQYDYVKLQSGRAMIA
jgi:hypothetical protein